MEKVKMVNLNNANAYKEVLVIINNLIKEDYDKIPIEYIDFFNTNANQNYDFEYDYSKSFYEQELLDETQYILFGLFKKFGATDYQKNKIQLFENTYKNELEKKKREIYNFDNLFKNSKAETQNSSNTIIEETTIVEYKEKNLFKKIFDKIKYFFKSNKI